jgi:chemotaxis protein methyltransferase CheR
MNQPDSIVAGEAEDSEVRSLLDAIYERYGIDFRGYADASIRRRIHMVLLSENLDSIPQLERRVMADRECMERFLVAATVNVTSMFRDPAFYSALRNEVIPEVRSRPFLRVWHAGCATGEEVYSLAILLREEGLGGCCRIYATDMNAAVLEKAKQGVFPLGLIQEYSRNYIEAGGNQPFSGYYTARYDHVVFDRTLRENIVFSQHNLVSDKSFNRFDIVLCRNVIIYFNRDLAGQVHHLLYESLLPAGFLCLGNRETIKFTPHESCYKQFHVQHRIYQKLK